MSLQDVHQLVTIRFSHYNEKARWILDYYSVPYVEEPYMPILHTLPVQHKIGMRGKADNISSPFSTPVLILPDNKTIICDSSKILQHICNTYASKRNMRNLYTTITSSEHQVADAIVQFEQMVHDQLGPHSRRVAYYYVLRDPQLTFELAMQNVGPFQAMIWKQMNAITVGGILSGLHVTPKTMQQSIAAIDKVFAQVEQLLQQSNGNYLFGNAFTVADLAFACMAAPALLVTPAEGYAAALPPLDKVHPELRALVQKWRNTIAGQYALRLFAQERKLHLRVIPCFPKL